MRYIVLLVRAKEACTASVSDGFARAAFFVGGLYAAISVYWGLGGTWLLNTVGGSLGHEKGGARVSVVVAVWAAAALKLVVAVLPLRVARGLPDSVRVQRGRLLTWLAAFILLAYGTVLTSIELLVQAGVIHASATADRRTLEWHAYLWDPWFLVWGLLLVAALRTLPSRRHSGANGSAGRVSG